MNGKYLKWAMSLVGISVYLLFTFWIFYPYEPLVVHQIKIMNPGKQVKAGDFLIYEITYTKKMNIVGLLVRKIENTYVYDLRESIASAPVGPGCDRVTLPTPSYADAAKDYKLRWTVRYPVNPVRWITVTAMSEEFEVVR